MGLTIGLVPVHMRRENGARSIAAAMRNRAVPAGALSNDECDRSNSFMIMFLDVIHTRKVSQESWIATGSGRT